MDDEGQIKLNFQGKRKTVDFHKESLAESWGNFKSFGLAPLHLQNYETTLFCKHFSFVDAEKHLGSPMMGPSLQNDEYVSIDYDIEYIAFETQLSALSVALSGISPATNAEAGDVSVLESVLRCFAPFPSISYREVYLESGSKNNVVGGKIDLLVGSKGNGNKKKLVVKEQSQAPVTMNEVWIVCIEEGKRPTVSLLPMKSVHSDFLEETKQNLSFLQPMMELMAISEVCLHSNEEVPLINIFGNRNSFRPLFYFQKYDVMLTTPKPFTYMIDNKILCLDGLFMFHMVCNLHRYPFKIEKLRMIKTTGWARAKHTNNPGAYKYSVVTDEQEASITNPNIMKPYLHNQRATALRARDTSHLPSTSRKRTSLPDTATDNARETKITKTK